MPGSFIPILEETGMIVDAGRWVLHEACRQGAEWHRAGHVLDLSVNVSMRQLENDSLIDDVCDALAKSGFEPTALVLEVTETALMHDAEATVRRLDQLKDLGIRIAIDDFGTGYSSLAYLTRFPVDTLKIDRSLIAGIGASTSALGMVQAVAQLGTALGLETLAEGIEEEAQLHQLQTRGIASGQGFLLAKPMGADEVGVLLDEQHIRPDAAPSAA
jgi:EAL domain-containing protein (putative c-di-GMP-specific phosphodiesterase class I)